MAEIENPANYQAETKSPVSVQEFSQKVKEKYPAYKNFDDAVLTSKFIERYPVYKEQVDFNKDKELGPFTADDILKSPQAKYNYDRWRKESSPAVDATEEELNESKGGFWETYAGDALQRGAKGSVNAARGLMSLTTMPQKIIANQIYKDVDNPESRRALTDSFVNIMTGGKASSLESGKELSEDLAEKSDRYDGQNFIDFAKKGEYGNMVGDVFLTATESLPQSLMAAFTGGAGLATIGATTTGLKYDEISDRTDINEFQKVVNATLSGTIEALSEKLGSVPIGKYLKDLYGKAGKEVAEEAVKKSLGGWMKKTMKQYGLFLAPVEEGIEEIVATIGENITDNVTGIESKPITEGAFESFVYGMGGGAQFSTMAVPGEINRKIKQRRAKKEVSKKPLDKDGNITTATVDGVKVFVKNSEDLGKEGKKIFIQDDQGNSQIVSQEKIQDPLTHTTEEAVDNIVSAKEQEDAVKQEQYNIQKDAAQRGIEEGKTVNTPHGKRTVHSVNDNGTITVQKENGEFEDVNADEVEAYKTQEQKDAEKQEEEVRKQLLEGIEEGAEISEDVTETLRDKREVRLIDFSNGQSKLITPEGEQIFNTIEERNAGITKLAESQVEEAAVEEVNVDELNPEERFNHFLNENEEVATVLLTDDIEAMSVEAQELRNKPFGTKQERAQNILEAQKIEAEAARLQEVMQRPAKQRMVNEAEQIVNEYEQEKIESPANNLEEWQQELLTHKVNPESFNQFGDRNSVTHGLRKAWLNPKNKAQDNANDIDILTKEFSETAGREVTPQEVVDFILQYQDKKVPESTPRMEALESKYNEVTERKIDQHDALKEELGIQPEITVEEEDAITEEIVKTPQEEIDEVFGKKEDEEGDAKFKAQEQLSNNDQITDAAPVKEEKESFFNITEQASKDLDKRPNAKSALEKISQELQIEAEIVNSAEMPEDVKQEEKKRLAKGKQAVGFFHPKTNKIYIVSDRINQETVADAKKTYIHEAVVHKGLSNLFKDGKQEIIGKQFAKFEELMSEVYESLTPTQRLSIAKTYFPNTYDQYFDSKGKQTKEISGDMKAYIGEEFLAELSELEQIPTKFQSFIDRLTYLIRKTFGLTNGQFTQSDLLNIIREQRGRMSKTKQDAKEVRIDEGQVQEGRTIGQEGQTESGQNLQQPEKTGTKTSEKEVAKFRTSEGDNFEQWKGGNRYVEDYEVSDVKTGEPIVARAYHGTTHPFYEFKGGEKGNIEGHLGKTNYFTSEYQDASQNYGEEGADLTSRIEQRKEQLEDEIGEWTDEEIKDLSEKFNLEYTEDEGLS